MRRRLLLVATCLAALFLSGCVTLPESGPVVDAGGEGSFSDEIACCYLPNGPRTGESPADIVQHFLEAMQATPIQTNVAKQFLTEAAGAVWDPEQQTIVYGERGNARGETRVSVALGDAHLLDSRGVFSGSLPPARRTLSFRMVNEAGEWRIANPENALIVPQTWTGEHFSSVAVYYVDPTARILVPEPVSVPRGEQFATALTQSLLSGPGPGLGDVARNFLPAGMSFGLSVPVDDEGVADVALQGDASGMAAEEAELAAVQLAWTLRQDPSIRSIRLTADGQALPGQPSLIPIDEGIKYDPAAFSASSALFALREGRLVSGPADAMTPVSGLPGTDDYGFTDIGVNLDSTLVAGLTDGATSVLVGPTYEPDGSLEQVVSGASSLLAPVWDFADRMWLVDRTTDGGQLILVGKDGPQVVEAPGISGERVRHLLVSRDGSRLVAVVRRAGRGDGDSGRARDELVASRVRYDDRGNLIAVTEAERLPWPTGERPRVGDIAWRTPTSLAVLYPVRDVVQVRAIPVDGSPAGLSAASSTLGGDFRFLVGSPEPTSPLYAASAKGYTDLSDSRRTTDPSDVDFRTLTYTG
ncbi:MAG: GerMN domain-containing protein [Nocardioides sp.]